MEFTPINTQEEFDARVTEVYGDVKGLQGQVETHSATIAQRDQTITQLQSEINGYKTTALKQRIAQEKGIPAEMAARLSGETEKDIRADADAMATMLRTYKGAPPMHDPEPKPDNSDRAGLRSLLGNLKGE